MSDPVKKSHHRRHHHGSKRSPKPVEEEDGVEPTMTPAGAGASPTYTPVLAEADEFTSTLSPAPKKGSKKGRRKAQAVAVVAPTRLTDIGINPLDIRELGKNPVVIAYAPRHGGLTTLLRSLAVGIEGTNAVVVLTDRADSSADGTPYMDGMLPSQLVLKSSGPNDAQIILRALIDYQSHVSQNDTLSAERPLASFVFVIDDVFYSKKPFETVAFLQDLKRAASFNISVLIGTANPKVLPNNITTFATHVFATNCVSTEDIGVLRKTLFVMFEKAADLGEALSMCGSFEFLIGLLAPPAGLPRTVEVMTRSYAIPPPEDLPRKLYIKPELVDVLTFTIKKAERK